MKKGLWILLLCLLCLPPLRVRAEEAARITSRTVQAAVHADKTITVTETIDLTLPEHEAYTLYLNLPDNSQIKAEDVVLRSDQAVLDTTWNEIKFNRDQNVRLQLNYTLRCFQDENEESDTLTLNLSRSLLELPIEQMHAEIQFDPELQRDNWVLDCGQSGGQCRWGSGKWQDQTFVFDSRETLDYQTLNLIVSFAEGTFAQAEAYRWPARYARRHIEIEILPSMDLQVHQEVELTTQNADLDPLFDLFLGWPCYPDALLEDVVISDPSLEISEYGFLRLPKNKPVALTMDYRIVLDNDEDEWFFSFDDSMNQAQIEDLDVVIRMPEALETSANFYNSRSYDEFDKVQMDVSEEGRRLHLTSLKTLNGDDRVSVHIEIPTRVRKVRAGGAAGFWSMFAVGLTLAAGLFRLLSRTRNQHVCGQLPEDVNPMQAALLADQPVGMNTAAALIIHWAARKEISVQMNGRFIQLYREPSLIQPSDWEKQLMRSLFNLGDGNTVTLEEIRGQGNVLAQQACHQAKAEMKQRQHSGLAGLRWLLIGLNVLPALVLTGVMTRWGHRMSGVFITGLLMIGMTFIFGARISALYRKGVSGRIRLALLSVLWLFLLGCFLAMVPAHGLSLAVCYGCLLIVQALLWPLRPLNPEGARLSMQVRQWRNDLKRMRDDKLDEWLDSDLDYALKSYGFAQALNCMDVWEKRFYERILPSLTSVRDAAGQPERIWVLDELYEQLQRCLKEK